MPTQGSGVKVKAFSPGTSAKMVKATHTGSKVRVYARVLRVWWGWWL